MSDDSLSASELRAQYARGGALKDSELTAAQLRARHGIQSNARDFSTKQSESGGMNPALIGMLVVVVLVAIIGYLLMQFGASKGGHEEL